MPSGYSVASWCPGIGTSAKREYAKAEAIIDDGAGRKAAATHGVAHSGTLAMLCESIRGGLLTVALVSHIADRLLEGEYRLPFGPGGLLTVALVSHIADRLLEGEYRLPFGPGGFARWAGGNGLV